MKSWPLHLLLVLLLALSCRDRPREPLPPGSATAEDLTLKYATGFSARRDAQGVVYLTVTGP